MAKRISMAQAAKDFASAIAGGENQMNIVTLCVKACQAHWQGETPLDADAADMANKVAELRGWSEKSVAARRSEIRKVIRHYPRMEAACKAVSDASESFTWHNAIKVARLLHKTPNASDANIVKAYFATGGGKPPKQPKDKALDALGKFMQYGGTAKDVCAIQKVVQAELDRLGIIMKW